MTEIKKAIDRLQAAVDFAVSVDSVGVMVKTTDLAALLNRNAFNGKDEMLAVLEEFSRACDGYLDGDGHPWELLQRARDLIAKHKERSND